MIGACNLVWAISWVGWRTRAIPARPHVFSMKMIDDSDFTNNGDYVDIRSSITSIIINNIVVFTKTLYIYMYIYLFTSFIDIMNQQHYIMIK